MHYTFCPTTSQLGNLTKKLMGHLQVCGDNTCVVERMNTMHTISPLIDTRRILTWMALWLWYANMSRRSSP